MKTRIHLIKNSLKVSLLIALTTTIACSTTKSKKEYDDFEMYGQPLDDLGTDEEYALDSLESDSAQDYSILEGEDEALELGSSIDSLENTDLGVVDQNESYDAMLDASAKTQYSEPASTPIYNSTGPRKISSSSTHKHVNMKSKVVRYKIKSGDSLKSISKKFYGTTRYSKALKRYNGIKNHNFILKGRYLRVPARF